MDTQFKYANLSKNQINFLYNYTPKNRFFTSTLEMKQIISKFGLDETMDVEDMRAIRNSVVSFYSFLSNENKEKIDSIIQSMQSITAVIDNQMVKIHQTL